ncbi:FkbM family methyltransferase [Pseudanabaena sp. FACHB-1998]|uniref:FkbM family methyltransferase n=1 Tax=Pseudanabaena sp. FACHB-1998 TaxID=2692858 RepID=UPI0016819FA4|nr:FkbM family methyltransferase [Pseudanabaena sp. FACHB-1998]MBD2176627.1 FkbM family methyltransferase [Pseudanabaena sp. FACHB-1998]
MKQLLRSLIHRLGFEPLHYSNDGLLQSLLKTYNELRLSAGKKQHYSLSLLRIASLYHLKQSLQLNKIDLLIDVGANLGQFALDARRTGYTGEIISFEPIAANQEYLNNLALADKDNNWKIIPYALGSETSELQLNVYKDDSFSSLHSVNFLAQSSFGKMVELDHVETVKIHTIDEVAESLGINPSRRIFLKTDTQGHDAEVIKGGQQTLNYVLGILTEATVKPLYDECVTLEDLSKLLASMGFVYGGMFPISYIPGTLELIELDCYFTRKSEIVGS